MKKHSGFTLIELMMVCAVVGVMVVVSVPNMGAFIKNQRIKSQMFDFLNALNIARSEAVKRKTTVTICSSADLDSTPTCAASTNWATGYIIFEDPNNDGTFTGGTDTVINLGNPLTGNNTFNSTGSSVRYQTDGSTLGTTRFAICDNRTPAVDYGRQINITMVGRASVEGGTGVSISSCTAPT